MTSRDDQHGAYFPFAALSNEDHNGKTTPRPTSPETEAAFLPVLKEALSDLPHDKKSELVHVQQVAPDLVDDDHLLIFLRWGGFNVELALQKLVEHWRQRCRVFGPENYALPMTLAGAMKDNLRLLKRGFLTLLPTCDEAGRPIIYVRGSVSIKPKLKIVEIMRTLWYIQHILMHNSDAQKNGYIRLVNLRDARPDVIDPRWPFRLKQLTSAFPIQFKTVHVRLANARFPLIEQAIKALSTVLSITPGKPAITLHNGSNERVLQSLFEHQLPKQCVPMEMGGTLNVLADSFFRDRLVIEGAALEPHDRSISGILSPSYSDENRSDPMPANRAGAQIGCPAESSVFFPFAPVQDESLNEITHQTISPEVKAAVAAASLRALKEKLACVPRDKHSSFVRVRQSAPALVDDDHLLIFLRAEGYDVDLALARLLKFWNLRHKVFGTESYALPMTLDGAMRDNLEVLKQGYMTILPVCDRDGRHILYIDRELEQSPKTDKRLQVLWYLLHILMHSSRPHKNGFVILVNGRGSGIKDWDPKWSAQGSLMNRVFPVQWHMVHVLNCKLIFRVMANAIKAVLSPRQRESLLMHHGSDQRVLESLAEQGLPKHCVPVNIGGTLHLSGDTFVQDRLLIEGSLLELSGRIATILSSNHADYGGAKSKTAKFESRSSAGISAASTTTNHIESRLKSSETIQISTEGWESISPHKKTHQVISSEIKVANASSHHALNADDKMGTFPAPCKNESTGSLYLSKSNTPGTMPTHLTSRTVTNDNLRREVNMLKRKTHTDAGNESKDTRADKSKKNVAKGIRRYSGAAGDPRMNLAVQVKLENPDLPTLAALTKGGYVFDDFANAPGLNRDQIKDTDNITLYQRRNQLMRRLRTARMKFKR